MVSIFSLNGFDLAEVNALFKKILVNLSGQLDITTELAILFQASNAARMEVIKIPFQDGFIIYGYPGHLLQAIHLD